MDLYDDGETTEPQMYDEANSVGTAIEWDIDGAAFIVYDIMSRDRGLASIAKAFRVKFKDEVDRYLDPIQQRYFKQDGLVLARGFARKYKADKKLVFLSLILDDVNAHTEADFLQKEAKKLR